MQTEFMEIPAHREQSYHVTSALEVRAVVGEQIVAAIIPAGSLNLDKRDQDIYAIQLGRRAATRKEHLAVLEKLRAADFGLADYQEEMLSRYKNGACVADDEGFLQINGAGDIVALREANGPRTTMFVKEEHRCYGSVEEVLDPKVPTHQQVEAIGGDVSVEGKLMRVVLTEASIGLSGREMEQYAAELGGRLGTAQEHEAYLKDLLYKKFDGTLTKAEEAMLKMHEENWVIHLKTAGPGTDSVEAFRIKGGKLVREDTLTIEAGGMTQIRPLKLEDLGALPDVAPFIVVSSAE
jgi:hypothetical protein